MKEMENFGGAWRTSMEIKAPKAFMSDNKAMPVDILQAVIMTATLKVQ